jgi:hypothetical protein
VQLLQELIDLNDDELLRRENAAATRREDLRQSLKNVAADIRTLRNTRQAREEAINFFKQVNKVVENDTKDGPISLHHQMTTVMEGFRSFAKAHGVTLE